MQYSLAIKGSGAPIHATKWMNLDNIKGKEPDRHIADMPHIGRSHL